ncbi:unnamed protein product, partial [Rotaria magnacalcarata]
MLIYGRKRSVYGSRITPYTATDGYDRNTGPCNTLEYGRKRSVYGSRITPCTATDGYDRNTGP